MAQPIIKNKYHIIIYLVSGFLALTLVVSAKDEMPEVTHDGLIQVKAKGSTDYAYILPGLDLKNYKRVKLLEAQISFRKNYLSDINRQSNINRVTSEDLATMIATGKRFFIEAFTESLEKGDINLTEEAGEDVLLVKAYITELDIYAPDPNKQNFGWVKIYTEAAGRATLTIELYDSVSGQILARAIDTKRYIGDNAGWQRPRDHYTNINDARQALSSWANQLTKRLSEVMGNT